MWHKTANFASTKVITDTLANVTSPVTFSVEDASRFPLDPPFWVSVDPSSTVYGEVMEIIDVDGPYFTAVRPGPISHPGAPRIICGPVSEYIDEIHAAIDTMATAASPAFTGIPTAPTAAPGMSSTQIATTEFVTTALALAASSRILGEELQGVDGVNVTFMTAYSHITESLQVYYNGIRVPNVEFSSSGVSVTLSFAPLPGDKVMVDYIRTWT